MIFVGVVTFLCLCFMILYACATAVEIYEEKIHPKIQERNARLHAAAKKFYIKKLWEMKFGKGSGDDVQLCLDQISSKGILIYLDIVCSFLFLPQRQHALGSSVIAKVSEQIWSSARIDSRKGFSSQVPGYSSKVPIRCSILVSRLGSIKVRKCPDRFPSQAPRFASNFLDKVPK